MSGCQSISSQFHGLFWSVYGYFAWDKQQPSLPMPESPEAIALCLRERRRQPEERVLDAGCGTGSYSVAMAEAGFQVNGIDFAAGMLAKARAKARGELSNLLCFEQADLNSALSFPAAYFDHAISMSVLQVVRDPTAMLAELKRCVKPGGTLIISLPKRVGRFLMRWSWSRYADSGWCQPLHMGRSWSSQKRTGSSLRRTILSTMQA